VPPEGNCRTVWGSIAQAARERSFIGSSLRQQEESIIQLRRLFDVPLRRTFTVGLSASWSEANMKELLDEMAQQAKVLGEANEG